MEDYKRFLEDKKIVDVPTGIKEPQNLNKNLFPFQHDIVKWALKRGRACIFTNTGTGKTIMQLSWADAVVNYTGGAVLILAPLAVVEQTIEEGAKFGITVNKLVADPFNNPGIYITNYEQFDNVKSFKWEGIAIDESSILKGFTSHFKMEIIEHSQSISFRLACSATPSPNDFTELGNHAEFMGVCKSFEMLSMFFINEAQNKQGEKWRLKKHAKGSFFEWVASWAVMINKPSDLGYSDEGYILPPLNIQHIIVDDDSKPAEGFLIPMEARTLQERQAARRATIEERARRAAEVANLTDETFLLWGNLNPECDTMEKLTDGAVQVAGSTKPEKKTELLLGFAKDKYDALVSKPKIAGFGLNWQNCHNMIFVGLSDSYEQYYQAVRRCWRFGQKEQVNVYIVTSSLEGAVVRNIERKEKQAELMKEEMIKHMHKVNEENIRGLKRETAEYKTDYKKGAGWEAYLGDSCEILPKIESNSIGYQFFSPPFEALYTFSNSERDLSNCSNYTEFLEHYKFIIREQYRVLMPGRNLSFHVMNTTLQKGRDGVLGIKDLRGDMIRLYQEAGFVFHSEVCVWKDPGIAMQRTKHIGLLHKQVEKDSTISRQGLADYIITMSKPGENQKPVNGYIDHYVGMNEIKKRDSEKFRSVEIWNKYASPVWMDINPSNTLQHKSARDKNDEKHMTPTQLEVIHRCYQLWTMPGDTILTPFGGIGSEGYEALKMGRKIISIELKESYYKQLVKNMEMAVSENNENLLFDLSEVTE